MFEQNRTQLGIEEELVWFCISDLIFWHEKVRKAFFIEKISLQSFANKTRLVHWKGSIRIFINALISSVDKSIFVKLKILEICFLATNKVLCITNLWRRCNNFVIDTGRFLFYFFNLGSILKYSIFYDIPFMNIQSVVIFPLKETGNDNFFFEFNLYCGVIASLY